MYVCIVYTVHRFSNLHISLAVESTERFTEGQATSLSYDSATRPSPLPSVSSTGDTQKDFERETIYWREKGAGEEPNHMTARKPGPLLIIYRGPGFLVVVWISLSPTPCLPSLVNKLGRRHRGDWERETTYWREKGERSRSRIIRPQGLVLCKSFNTLCLAGTATWAQFSWPARSSATPSSHRQFSFFPAGSIVGLKWICLYSFSRKCVENC